MEKDHQQRTDFKELGKKGGTTTLKRYGKDHFKRIGAKGRASTSEEARHERGVKGGLATFEKHGREHMIEMSRKAQLARGKKLNPIERILHVTKLDEMSTTSSIGDWLSAIAQGNLDAASVLTRLLKEDAVGDGLFYVGRMDEAGIYGSDLWILYKDVCAQDVSILREMLDKQTARAALEASDEYQREHAPPREGGAQ